MTISDNAIKLLPTGKALNKFKQFSELTMAGIRNNYSLITRIVTRHNLSKFTVTNCCLRLTDHVYFHAHPLPQHDTVHHEMAVATTLICSTIPRRFA